MICIMFLWFKLKYLYYRAILLYRYNQKPNNGSFDLMNQPAFKNAKLWKDI